MFKMKVVLPVVVIAFIAILLTSNRSPMEKDYKKMWDQVDSLNNLQQPRSALEIVEEIYQLAKKENNQPQVIKANLYRISLMAGFEEDHLPKAISQVKNEILTAKSPEKQILNSILAELYQKYYQSNAYNFLNRSQTVNFDNEDINTWDAQKILLEAKNCYLASLEDAGELKKIKLESFQAILEEEKGSKTFRPTLFDFLAHRAIDFLATDETSVTMASKQFNPSEAKYFDPAASFINIQPEEKFKDNSLWLSLNIYQQLLAFHVKDDSPQAPIDVDLARLNVIHEKSTLETKDSLYLTALNGMFEKYSGSPYSTQIAFELAQFYMNRSGDYKPLLSEDYRWEKKKAAEMCQAAMDKFPETDGAKNCKILLDQIVLPSLDIKTEQAVIDNKNSLALLSWKNIDRVYFRILKMNYNDFREKTSRNEISEIASALTKEPAIKNWEVAVPNDGDFQEHSTETEVSALPEDFYVLLASSDKTFSNKNQLVSWVGFWSTNLSYVSRTAQDGSLEFYLMHRETGNPLKSVKVNVYSRDYDYQLRKYRNDFLKTFLTDELGYLKINSEDISGRNRNLSLEFLLENDTFIPEQYFYLGRPVVNKEKTQVRTHFFTDRSIYRPGQTVYFKGIMLEQTGDKSVIAPGRETKVEFFDVNGQKISEQSLKSNDFGSVNGSFTIPTGLLNGNMTIRNESDQVSILVEDYKRPTFEVTFDPLKESYKLGQEITINGLAKAYAGNFIDGAKVSYRVVRNSIFPYRDYFWSRYFRPFPEMEITSVETSTSPEGRFSVSFMATPDSRVNEKFKPAFSYSLQVTVTDINGENRTGEQSVMVGKQALFLDVNIPEKVDQAGKNEFLIKAANLNGIKQETTVKVEVFKLKNPERMISSRLWEQPEVFVMNRKDFTEKFPNREYRDELNPEKWEKETTLLSKELKTGTDSLLKLDNMTNWQQGKYLVKLTATDVFGTKVETEKYFTMFSPEAKTAPLNTFYWFTPIKTEGEPGEQATFLIGTQARKAKVLYEIWHKGQTVSREWISLDREQKLISIPIEEKYRGNFSVQVTLVQDSRVYQNSMEITVPFTNKKLDLAFETFRSELTPGGKEEWKITIRDKKGDKVAAEMLASMYDQSLDAFLPHNWFFNPYMSYSGMNGWHAGTGFSVSGGMNYNFNPPSYESYIYQNYDRLNWFGYNAWGMYYDRLEGGAMRMMGQPSKSMEADGAVPEMAMANVPDETREATNAKMENPPATGQEISQSKPSFAGVQVRRDFRETAFFYSDLRTNEKGDVVFSFTMPESFTKWRFMSLAHTTELANGMLEKEFTASKKLMVVPNAPRFFRSGDTLDFSVKVVNLSDESITGTALPEFFDGLSMTPISIFAVTGNIGKPFTIEAGRNISLKWKIIIPEETGVITYRVKAVAGNFTDGEEKTIPVLPNRMMVTESLPLPINGKQSKDFSFTKLMNSGQSSSLKNYRLTLEFASNPAWYAVQALPVMSEPDYKNAISVFGSFYANSIAFYLANSDPKIQRVFESWKNQTPESLLSKLEKNQELKNILLQQTPWVMEAKSESERKQRIALLFDLNNMQNRLDASIRMLEKLQTPGGGFTWFDGMPESRYITQYLAEGFGKLDHLGIIDAIGDDRVRNMMNKAIRFLENEIKEDYENVLKYHKDKMDENHISATQIQFLYTRSFYKYIMMNPSCETAFNYFKMQAAKYWKNQNLYLQAMTSLALHRYNEKDAPGLILKSLKEKSLTNEEMGMYWRSEGGYYWYEAPVETQAMMIEAFDEVTGDKNSVELMKQWLLKQKQTQDWKTNRATAEAVYALLGRGTNLLAGDKLVDIQLGAKTIGKAEMGQTEAGTGYFKTSWSSGEFDASMGKVKVTKSDEGIAWGALYWQYFEDLDKITPHETPLSLKKQLFIEKNSPDGKVITPVNDGEKLKTGDKIIVRIELRADRDMEYVHMNDMRASALEPVNVLSGYRYRDGLGYYESTRDAATSFFFEYLRKGTYVFEYPLLVSQTGDFSNGITTIQCMYAPEFSSHSEGIRIKIE